MCFHNTADTMAMSANHKALHSFTNLTHSGKNTQLNHHYIYHD